MVSVALVMLILGIQRIDEAQALTECFDDLCFLFTTSKLFINSGLRTDSAL